MNMNEIGLAVSIILNLSLGLAWCRSGIAREEMRIARDSLQRRIEDIERLRARPLPDGISGFEEVSAPMDLISIHLGDPPYGADGWHDEYGRECG